MKSRFEYLKTQAVRLRIQGYSIRDIEIQLRIPRSTLSGWLKTTALSPKHKSALETKHREALAKARKSAVVWHNVQKQKRLATALDEARATLLHIKDDLATLEVALAMLYLGEGAKGSKGMRMGSSDPNILRFFLEATAQLYGVERHTARAGLHLRADQDEKRERAYWSKELGLQPPQITYVIRDKRTAGIPTYPTYHGVCSVSFGNLAIQRKLVYLSEEFVARLAQR